MSLRWLYCLLMINRWLWADWAQYWEYRQQCEYWEIEATCSAWLIKSVIFLTAHEVFALVFHVHRVIAANCSIWWKNWLMVPQWDIQWSVTNNWRAHRAKREKQATHINDNLYAILMKSETEESLFFSHFQAFLIIFQDARYCVITTVGTMEHSWTLWSGLRR